MTGDTYIGLTLLGLNLANGLSGIVEVIESLRMETTETSYLLDVVELAEGLSGNLDHCLSVLVVLDGFNLGIGGEKHEIPSRSRNQRCRRNPRWHSWRS